MTSAWVVRLGSMAEQDYAEIIRWTAKTFGVGQAEIYAQTISLAIEALTNGPDILGTKARDDIEAGIRTLHIARGDRKGRHFVIFRTTNKHAIDVLRVLHDSMDFARHIPAANDLLR